MNKVQPENSIPYHDRAAYHKLSGRLLYLTTTWPNISYYVQQLSQHTYNPLVHHRKAIIWILRYLKGTPGQGVFFSAASHLKLKAFSDVDWGTCPEAHKSITGYCVFLGGSLVSWKSKQHPTIFISSSKSEYGVFDSTVCDLLWLTYLLKYFQLPFIQPASLYSDSHPARHMSFNVVFHERMKHIDRLPRYS